jgi:Holliday junction resolvase
MANTSYARGRAREYRAMHLLRQWGWVCSRSAMSHGPVDIFAAKNGEILLIQVKSGSSRLRPPELRLFRGWAQAFDATAELWHFPRRGRLQRHVVYHGNRIHSSGLGEEPRTVPRTYKRPRSREGSRASHAPRPGQ